MRESMKSIMAGVPVMEGTRPRLVASSTVRYTRPDGAECVRYHRTDVAVRVGDVVTLHDGGWRSKTTKERMMLSGVRIWQRERVLYVSAGWRPGGDDKPVRYFDGVRIDLAACRVLNAQRPSDARREARLEKGILACAGKLARMEKVPAPAPGDCLICCFDAQREGCNDHILAHIREKYVHGSLVYLALKWAAVGDAGMRYWFAREPKVVARYLKRYLRFCAGLVY